MFRIYTERKNGFEIEAKRIMSEVKSFLGVNGVTGIRYLNRYDIENVSDETATAAANRIFSEPQSDICMFQHIPLKENDIVIAWEYLPGQYDQRSDSAEQCLSLLNSALNEELSKSNELSSGNIQRNSTKPAVRCAKMVILSGDIAATDISKIEKYLINPVDSRLASLEIPETLKMTVSKPGDIPVLTGFINLDQSGLSKIHSEMGLAMDMADIKFLQEYFKKENRDPTETEIRVLDTYWSDHCRHTTFNTVLDNIKIDDGDLSKPIIESLEEYKYMRDELYAERAKKGASNEKPLTLMDIACIGAKYLKKHGKLDDIELSEEINACSIYIDVDMTDVSSTNGASSTNADTASSNCAGESSAKSANSASTTNSCCCENSAKQTKTERWLLQFKNETHNHPTEIEPFGGAATCIGGAIRDPLSGRAWVYQALRVTGAANPTVSLSETREGKLPQMKLTREAAQGFSSYGNQIGLTTGQVAEMYHPGFEAKRMELGAVIAAVPANVVKREEPDAGDIIVLVGGGTGRDGIGGATGSSKVHNVKSVTTAAAEVQKGNAIEERKIQRFFRNRNVCEMIRRCNDFGAGGVSVAVGELAPGLEINLDAVPKKYEGLNGTELAISESQERMALVVRKKDVDAIIEAAKAENLNAVVIATVTDKNRLVMNWKGKTIVDIDRAFLDTAGASRSAIAHITTPVKEDSPLCSPLASVVEVLGSCATPTCEADKPAKLKKAWLSNLQDLATCSQRGLSERFDGSIGASTIVFPMGGKYQGTPESGCVAKIPVLPPFETETSSLMTFGYDPRVAEWSPYHGSQAAVLQSLARITALGGNPESCRLTFQEYFERTTSEEAWGKPTAALLGALSAQEKMGTASIGGKDSMSGSFQELKVPPTLVSFAVATEKASNIKGGAFTKQGSTLFFVPCKYNKDLTPSFKSFKAEAKSIYKANKEGLINAMYPVGAGGIAEAITKMAFGNKIGASITKEFCDSLKTTDSIQQDILRSKGNTCSNWMLFIPMYGSLIVEVDTDKVSTFEALFEDYPITKMGTTTKEPIISIKNAEISLEEAEKVWEQPLSVVFPPFTAGSTDENTAEKIPSFATVEHESLIAARKTGKIESAYTTSTKNCATTTACGTIATGAAGNVSTSQAKPKVLLPVFPGTNCEFDMARAFSLAGADTKILVFRNNTPEALEESLEQLKKELSTAQILALSGGFSAGDEPDGSGKFIANVLRESRIADGVMELLDNRKGLILGICNGFQALIKVGLVPYGKIMAPSEEMPTLTYNRIGRHISRIAETRIVSATSPWANHSSVLEPKTHLVPISHGEGRIIISESLAKDYFKNGQVFSQYVNEQGIPVMTEPNNPNGSMYAIEGLTSPDGRVLGKMGHNERTIGTNCDGSSNDLIKNISGSKCQNIFAAGVSYFK